LADTVWFFKIKDRELRMKAGCCLLIIASADLRESEEKERPVSRRGTLRLKAP